MMRRETVAIADIYVPVKRRATLDQKRVDEITTSMLDKGQQAPILVRAEFVLVEGLHRLEAAKALGEKNYFLFPCRGAEALMTLAVEAPTPSKDSQKRRNKWSKIAIVMEQRRAVFNTPGSDQEVDFLADCDSAPT